MLKILNPTIKQCVITATLTVILVAGAPSFSLADTTTASPATSTSTTTTTAPPAGGNIQMLPPTILGSSGPNQVCVSGTLVYSGDNRTGYAGINCVPSVTIDSSGNVSTNAAVTANNLAARGVTTSQNIVITDQTESAGKTCTGKGMIAENADGALLSCQYATDTATEGTWQVAGGASSVPTPVSGGLIGSFGGMYEYDSGIGCTGGNPMAGGGCRCPAGFHAQNAGSFYGALYYCYK